MQELREWQRAMRASLIAQEPAVIESLADGVSADRLDVYRNTIFSGLTRALRLAFPAVERLVGAEFFDGAADIFIRTQLPRTACLDQYGDAFPNFLQGFAPAAALPYLADVARLEWAVNSALHAADETPIELAQLAAIGAEDQGRISFRARASISLLRTHHPCDDIWRAVLGRNDEALAALNPASGPVLVLVERGEDGIAVDRLLEPAWRFLWALCAGDLRTRRSKRLATSTRRPHWPSISPPAASSPSHCAHRRPNNRTRLLREEDRMTDMATSTSPHGSACATMGRTLRWLNQVPYAVLALPLRFAVATVFWNSAMTKLANWETTIALFTDDYKVPLLPPELAAPVALTIELTAPVLLVLGLFTRSVALVLLGMTAVIEIFVYPQAWPTHIQWAAMLLVLLTRGAGAVSIDHWLWRRFGKMLGAEPGLPGR